jgi:hypothetical protein
LSHSDTSNVCLMWCYYLKINPCWNYKRNRLNVHVYEFFAYCSGMLIKNGKKKFFLSLEKREWKKNTKKISTKKNVENLCWTWYLLQIDMIINKVNLFLYISHVATRDNRTWNEAEKAYRVNACISSFEKFFKSNSLDQTKFKSTRLRRRKAGIYLVYLFLKI